MGYCYSSLFSSYSSISEPEKYKSSFFKLPEDLNWFFLWNESVELGLVCSDPIVSSIYYFYLLMRSFFILLRFLLFSNLVSSWFISSSFWISFLSKSSINVLYLLNYATLCIISLFLVYIPSSSLYSSISYFSHCLILSTVRDLVYNLNILCFLW